MRRAFLVGGLAMAAGLFTAALLLMPAHPEGPPRPLPWYVFYASLAVATLTLAAAGMSAWRSDEGRRRDLAVFAGVMAGVAAAVGLAGLAFHAYLEPPHNLVECARDGYTPHRLFCSYHNRNTPLAHRQANEFLGAALVVFVAALGVLGCAERRRIRLPERPPGPEVASGRDL